MAKYDTADAAVADWLHKNGEAVEEKVEALRSESVARSVAELMASDLENAAKGVRQVVGAMPCQG